MPTIDHLALASRDPVQSFRFYRDIIGVDGAVREEEYGFVISTATGVNITLLRGEPPATMGDFHVGVSLPNAAAVRAARERFRSLGLIEHVWWDEGSYVSVKIADPDGYIVEVSWDGHAGPS